MDVLHLIHQFPPETRGGSEAYVEAVAARQRARGVEAAVLAGSLEWRARVEIDPGEWNGIPVHRLHRDDFCLEHHAKNWHPVVGTAFADFLRRERPSLVHVHHWLRLTADLAAIAARLGVPSVVTLHDCWTSCPRIFRRRPGDPACSRELSPENCSGCVPRFGHERADEIDEAISLHRDGFASELSIARRVLVASPVTADLLSRTTGLSRDRYTVLPFGRDRRFKESRGPSEPADPLRFAYWGVVAPHKGIDVLLDAAGRLASRFPGRFRLDVLGDFESEECEKRVRAAASGLPVAVHGPFDSADLLGAAPHCGVFPSVCFETYGIAVDECFELGLPCIVSDLGALPARAHGAGIVVPAGDAEALAAAMGSLIEDEGLRQRLSRSIPAPPPTLDEHVDRLEAIYREAVQAKEPFAEPISADRRLALMLRQRESALARIAPEGPRG
ncbi:MAG: glycosyltransferase family 4 protein [Planctomycetota bacterium]